MTSPNRVPALLSLLVLLGAAVPAAAATFVVNANAAAGGDGSAGRPFRSLREAGEVSGPGDAIVVARGTGPYDESIALKTRQTLSAAVDPAAAPAPVIASANGDAIVMAAGSTVAGITIRATGHAGIVARDAGDLTIRDVAFELSGGARGIVLRGISGSISIQRFSMDGAKSADQGIAIEESKATVAIAGGTIRDVRKRGISIAGSGGISLQDMKFIRVSSENAAPAAVCGRPSPAGDHLACGAALHMQNVSGITLERVTIEDSAQTAITGDGVRDLTMSAVQILGAGDENNEHGVQLRNLSGHVRISDSRFEGNETRQLYLVNDAGEADIEIHHSSFRGAAPPNGQQGILLHVSGDARVRFAIDASTFTRNFGNAVQVIAESKSNVAAQVTGSTFRGNSAAFTASAADAATLTYRIANNTVEQSTATALNIHGTTSGSVSGEIEANVIGSKGKTGSGAVCGGGCSGIAVTAIGHGTSAAAISRNTIQQTDANGISVRAGGDATLDVRITGNVVREPAGTDALHAISVAAGMRKTDRAVVCAEVGGEGDLVNTVSGAWNAAGPGIGLMRRGDAVMLSIARYAGDRANAGGLSKFVAGRNRGTAVDAQIGTGVTLSDGCAIPRVAQEK